MQASTLVCKTLWLLKGVNTAIQRTFNESPIQRRRISPSWQQSSFGSAVMKWQG